MGKDKVVIFIAHNLEIEPIPIHPQLGGIETIKTKLQIRRNILRNRRRRAIRQRVRNRSKTTKNRRKLLRSNRLGIR